MREIIQFLSEGHVLPTVTSDDASRLYASTFLDQITANGPAAPAAVDVSSFGAAVPDPASHHRAKQCLERAVAAFLNEAGPSTSAKPETVAQHIFAQTQMFVAANRMSAWADNVFRRMCAVATEAHGVVVEKDNQHTPANRVGVADVYALHANARQLASANRKTVARAVCRLMEAAAAMDDAASTTYTDTVAMLASAVKLFMSEGLGTYRNEFETAMLTHFDSVLNTTAAGTTAPPAPGMDEGCRRFRAFARLGRAVLHPSSVRPLLNLVANDLFRTKADLTEAIRRIGHAHLVVAANGGGNLDIVAGLLIRHRQSDWVVALESLLVDTLREAGAPNPRDGDSALGTAARVSRVVDAALRLASTPGLISAATVATQLPAAIASTAEPLFTTPGALAQCVDRMVKCGTLAANEAPLRALFEGMRKARLLDFDALGEALERCTLRRALSFNGFWVAAAEEVHTRFAIATVGVARFSRARRVQVEAAESNMAVERTMEVFRPGFQLQMRAFGNTWIRDVASASYFVGAPLPAALVNAWADLSLVYREAHPRRRLHHVSNASRVTLRWCATGTTITMSSIHLSFLEAVLDPAAFAAATDALPVEARDLCLRDLCAAGVLVRRRRQDEEDAAAVAMAPSTGCHFDGFGPDEANLRRRASGEIVVILGMSRAKPSGTDAPAAAEAVASAGPRLTPQHRRFLLEAAVMRLLKKHEAMPLPDIYRRCLGEARLAFEPTAKDIRACVNSLESKEYATIGADGTVCFKA